MNPSAFPFIMCPSCGLPLEPPGNSQWGCPHCPDVAQVREGLPLFAVRASELGPIVAGIRASHAYNKECPRTAHLEYTEHTVHHYRVIRRIIERSFDSVRRDRGITVLDVGGGRGELAALLAESFRTAMIDVDWPSAQAATRMQHGGARFPVLCSDCSSLPVASRSFDVVIAKDTSHHMADPQLFFRELGRVVREDGIVLLSEGVLSDFSNRTRAAANDRMRQLGATHHHYVQGTLTSLLDAEFAATRIVWAEPPAGARLLAKFGCKARRTGAWLDGLWTVLPHAARKCVVDLAGGTTIVACREPRAPVRAPGGRKEKFVPYPIELAGVDSLPEAVVEEIRELVQVAEGR